MDRRKRIPTAASCGKALDGDPIFRSEDVSPADLIAVVGPEKANADREKRRGEICFEFQNPRMADHRTGEERQRAQRRLVALNVFLMFGNESGANLTFCYSGKDLA
jgi:hypothetical protein